MQQQGLAEQQLAVVRVLFQQTVEALQQAVAGVRIGLRCGQGEEVEVGVALALQHALHIVHGFVVPLGAGQLHGSRALGVEVVRVALGPDQRGVQGRLLGAQVFGDAEAALGDAGVLGGVGLLYVIAQGDIEAIALSSELCREQGEQGFLGERGVLLGLRRLRYRGSLLHRRCAVRCGRAEHLAAAQQSQGGQ